MEFLIALSGQVVLRITGVKGGGGIADFLPLTTCPMFYRALGAILCQSLHITVLLCFISKCSLHSLILQSLSHEAVRKVLVHVVILCVESVDKIKFMVLLCM